MMKETLKGMFSLTVGSILAGETVQQIGNSMTGSLKGIGSATQSMVGVGLLGSATKLFKWK